MDPPQPSDPQNVPFDAEPPLTARPAVARPVDGVAVSEPPPTPLRPVARSERIEAIDIVRGFALLGVFTVNMLFFHSPAQAAEIGLSWWTNPVDWWAAAAIGVFASGKFYAMFSLLFGLGMALQMERADRRGVSFARYFLRRLAVLLGFGLTHMLLLWYGDILTLYAVLGTVLLLFHRASSRVALFAASVAYVTPVVLVWGLMTLVALAETEKGPLTPTTGPAEEALVSEMADSGFDSSDAATYEAAEKALERYASDDWRDVFAQRRSDLKLSVLFYVFAGPSVAAWFLVGMVLGRVGVFVRPAAFGGWLRLAVWIGLPLGVIGSVAGVWLEQTVDYESMDGIVAALAVTFASAPLLMLGYVSAILLLLEKPGPARVLRYLGPVGRMALTNYLGQSLICTTIFYGYGLGWFGQVGAALGLLVVAVIFGVQILLSHWWLSRFAQGPMEWLWRRLAYSERPAGSAA